MPGKQVGGGLLDHPGDVCGRIALPQGGQGRQGMDDIADGAQFDDQDVQDASLSMIHFTASSRSAAIWTGRTTLAPPFVPGAASVSAAAFP